MPPKYWLPPSLRLHNWKEGSIDSVNISTYQTIVSMTPVPEYLELQVKPSFQVSPLPSHAQHRVLDTCISFKDFPLVSNGIQNNLNSSRSSTNKQLT